MLATQVALETRLALRQGEQVLLTLVIPLALLIGLSLLRVVPFPEPRVTSALGTVLALAVMSTAFTSLAIATGFERRYGVIKRLGSSPLPRSGLLAGKVGALLVVEALQVILISVVGLLLGWDPAGGFVAGALLAFLLGTGAFAALGLFLAGVLRAEATLAAANLVYLLLMAAGAVVLPSSSYGSFGPVTELLPSGALGDAMRHACLEGGVAWGDLGVLLLWGLLGTVLTARTFRWE
jgi:ABC-2 type transport system permease protein